MRRLFFHFCRLYKIEFLYYLLAFCVFHIQFWTPMAYASSVVAQNPTPTPTPVYTTSHKKDAQTEEERIAKKDAREGKSREEFKAALDLFIKAYLAQKYEEVRSRIGSGNAMVGPITSANELMNTAGGAVSGGPATGGGQVMDEAACNSKVTECQNKCRQSNEKQEDQQKCINSSCQSSNFQECKKLPPQSYKGGGASGAQAQANAQNQQNNATYAQMNNSNAKAKAAFNKGMKAYYHVQDLIKFMNNNAKSAIQQAITAKEAALALIGSPNAEFALRERDDDAIEKQSDTDRKLTLHGISINAVATASVTQLKCKCISDAEPASYHLFIAAGALHLAMKIGQTSDYTENTGEIMESEPDPENEYDEQVRKMTITSNLHQEVVDHMYTREQAREITKRIYEMVLDAVRVDKEVKDYRNKVGDANKKRANDRKKNADNLLSMILMIVAIVIIIVTVAVMLVSECCAAFGVCCAIAVAVLVLALLMLIAAILQRVLQKDEKDEADEDKKKMDKEKELAVKHSHMECDQPQLTGSGEGSGGESGGENGGGSQGRGGGSGSGGSGENKLLSDESVEGSQGMRAGTTMRKAFVEMKNKAALQMSGHDSENQQFGFQTPERRVAYLSGIAEMTGTAADDSAELIEESENRASIYKNLVDKMKSNMKSLKGVSKEKKAMKDIEPGKVDMTKVNLAEMSQDVSMTADGQLAGDSSSGKLSTTRASGGTTAGDLSTHKNAAALKRIRDRMNKRVKTKKYKSSKQGKDSANRILDGNKDIWNDLFGDKAKFTLSSDSKAGSGAGGSLGMVGGSGTSGSGSGGSGSGKGGKDGKDDDKDKKAGGANALYVKGAGAGAFGVGAGAGADFGALDGIGVGADGAAGAGAGEDPRETHGLKDSEVDEILEDIRGKKGKYDVNTKDTIWRIISKSYIRNAYPRLLKKKKKKNK